MARVEATTHIEASPERVWEVLVDWEGQAAWMVDADSVTVLSPHREGPDVTIRALTRLGPAAVRDDMAVTDWQEHRLIAIRHLGLLIRGVGAWELTPTAHGTRFVWWEELELPLGQLGELAGNAIVAPWVKRNFRASLAGLKRVCESSSARP
jgi:hypothetical protein